MTDATPTPDPYAPGWSRREGEPDDYVPRARYEKAKMVQRQGANERKRLMARITELESENQSLRDICARPLNVGGSKLDVTGGTSILWTFDEGNERDARLTELQAKVDEYEGALRILTGRPSFPDD